jgi:thioredoxin 1
LSSLNNRVSCIHQIKQEVKIIKLNIMRKLLGLFIVATYLFVSSCSSASPDKGKEDEVKSSGTIIHLTDALFKEKVFNYGMNKDWKYEGNKPCIIDFYADWCGPCRKMAPILEEISREYAGKIIIYKVDTQVEQFLTQSMGITGLPTLLFCPMKGKPQASMGAMPKETLIKAINDVLLTNN